MKKDNFYTHKFLPVVAIILFILNIFCTNTVFGANVNALNTWVEENKDTIAELFKGYEYVVMNNTYMSRVYIYYSNVPNTKFYFNSENAISGDRRMIRATGDKGNNYFGLYWLNTNGDNIFTLPPALPTDTGVTDNSTCIVNNYSPANILYCSSEVYGDNCVGVISEKKTFPIPQPKVVVGEITKVEELIPMIIQVMKVIIPTGLLILSMVLLIYVVKSVISRMT